MANRFFQSSLASLSDPTGSDWDNSPSPSTTDTATRRKDRDDAECNTAQEDATSQKRRDDAAN